MTSFPSQMAPTEYESLALPSGRQVFVGKCTPSFRQWNGDRKRLGPTYDSKPRLELDGCPVFAEVLVLADFLSLGWDGIWVDTFHRSMWKGMPSEQTRATVSETIRTRLECIGAREPKARCWDVVAWQDDQLLFCEVKHSGKDKIRESQLRWVDAALMEGISVSQFLVVEWSL